MSKAVITLPRDLGTRHLARRIAQHVRSEDVVVNAGEAVNTSVAAVDELVKTLISSEAERVIVVNASALLERQLRTAHRARATPERTFLLTFRTVSAEALLRSA